MTDKQNYGKWLTTKSTWFLWILQMRSHDRFIDRFVKIHRPFK